MNLSTALESIIANHLFDDHLIAVEDPFVVLAHFPQVTDADI